MAIKMELPSNYPLFPPIIHFIQPIYHLNVNQKTGELKMPLLVDQWSQFISISSVIDQIQNIMREPDENFAASEQIKFLFQRSHQNYFQKVRMFVSQKIKNQTHPIKLNQVKFQNKSKKGSDNNKISRTHTIQSQKVNSLHASGFDELNFALLLKDNSQLSQQFGEDSVKIKNTPIIAKKEPTYLITSRVSQSQRISRSKLNKIRSFYSESRQKNLQQEVQIQEKKQFSKIIEQSQQQASRWQKASALYQSKDISPDKNKLHQKGVLKQSQLIKIPQIQIQIKEQSVVLISNIQKQSQSLNSALQKVNKEIQIQMSEYNQVKQLLKKVDHQKLKQIFQQKQQRSIEIIQQLQNLALLIKKKIVQNLTKETRKLL